MKILHCCLAAFYIDNYGYQENILPKMHKLQGHDVYILASTETYINNLTLGYITPKSYYTNDGIPITRIPYTKWLPHFIAKKLRIYEGIYKTLVQVGPDIIFLHDAQFLGINQIVKYAKRNRKVKIYVDGHTDFINSATNWISKNILHKIIYKHCVKNIEPYTRKFYGVLPLRVDFFKEVYKVPDNKVELLLMGADDTLFDLSKSAEKHKEIRNKYNIPVDAFVIVTGGKIDRRKNTHLLIQAFNELNIANTKLFIFGSITNEIKDEIEELLSQSKEVIFAGWQSSEETNNVLLASELAVFPGTHSVLWEQAVALGLPCIFKKWDGIQHVDVGGNCLFIDDVNILTLKNILNSVIKNQEIYDKMKSMATIGAKKFSYYEIAKYAIEQ